MIHYIKGNIFDSKCKCLVNTVNCVGVMGKGLALQFKTKYPHIMGPYKEACSKGKLKEGGDIWIFSMQNYIPFDFLITNYPKILCFATKEHWRNPSKLEWIERGLQNFINHYKEWKIKTIAFPKLGCTNGGLKWKEVKKLMEKYLNSLDDIYIEVYE